MVASKPSGQGGGKRSNVDEGNVVEVTLGDLPEEEQRRVKEEMRWELEELEAIKMCEKLACYQKTWNGVVQKADTAKDSSPKLNSSSLSPEDLVHLVDVSVASKYGTDLAQLTRAMGEDLCNTLDLFRHDLDNSLPRQIQLVVKEVMGNIQGKQAIDVTIAAAPQIMPLCGGSSATAGGGGYHNM
jgi:hypothetical protein